MMSQKLALIQQLAAEMIDKNICPQLAAQATQLVMGGGNPDADIVIVGEAPGKKEDEQGLPFVGATGRFLDEMLASASMSREDVYITNIVKYRPPSNRDPSPEEKAAFLPYLLRQLEIIDPKAVITLGRHSMEYFLPEAKISQVHGHAIRKKVVYHDKAEHEGLIIPLYHPAAALYNGGMRQTLIDDFVNAARLVDELKK